MNIKFECVLDIRAQLGECPLWSVDEQVLYWVDINAPALNRFDPVTGKNTAWPMPEAIGCVALRAKGGFVVGLRSGFYFVEADGRLGEKIAQPQADPAIERFNDGRADRAGRFWAGTIWEPRDRNGASLFLLDPDHSCHRTASEMMVSNGLAFSPDNKTMYHTDTPTHAVHQYDYDIVSGSIANRRLLHQFPVEGPLKNGRPDGGAVDAEGNYWTAMYEGGRVVKLSPNGEILGEYPLLAMSPTMPAFGGPDLKTLYVTSARQRRSDEELAALPFSGGIFAMRVDVPGLPEPKFAG